jgi:hypothetical protein
VEEDTISVLFSAAESDMAISFAPEDELFTPTRIPERTDWRMTGGLCVRPQLGECLLADEQVERAGALPPPPPPTRRPRQAG